MASTMVTLQTDLFFGSKFLAKTSLTSTLDIDWLNQRFAPSIQLSSFSIPSDRLSPQLVMHTICENGLLFKLSPSSPTESLWSELRSIHISCMLEKKSIFAHIEGRELHLVAVEGPTPCFWAYVCRTGQYSVCCSMLNQRTLALVFDLDETLIIANTMKSFDDRIASAERRLRAEPEPEKQAQFKVESNSLQKDRDLLRDYMDRDKVLHDEQEFEAQFEEAPSAVTPGLILQRPIIRLPGGVILTRINPTNRDTSVLVKIRPFWEDLREYIIVSGRKRFEPFVCTLSEKEYAWEVWRLLDPGGRLIEWGSLKVRVVCVRPDIKKALLGVFSGVCCHPAMAIVIDDRLKVWEEEDQSRVHVVPQYAPYSFPGLEEGLELKVMHNARNAIYNIRAAYFKCVDEDLTQAGEKLTHDVHPATLPPRPDVSMFLKAAPSFPLAPVSANGGPVDGLTGPEEQAQLGGGAKAGEESGSRGGVGGGDSAPEVSSRAARGDPSPGVKGEWPVPPAVAEKEGEEGPETTDDISNDVSMSAERARATSEERPNEQRGERGPLQRTGSVTGGVTAEERDSAKAAGVQMQTAVNALGSLSGGQQIDHEQLRALLAAAPLLVNAAPQLAAILPQIQTLFNLQQQQLQQGAPPKPPTPPGQPPPHAHSQHPQTPIRPPLPPGPPPPQVIEQARAVRPQAPFPKPPTPTLPPGFPKAGSQPPLPPGAPPGARPGVSPGTSTFQQQVQAMKQQQEQRQQQLKAQKLVQQAMKNQPPPPLHVGRLPSPRGLQGLPSPGVPFPGHMPGMPNSWEPRPSPRGQAPFPPGGFPSGHNSRSGSEGLSTDGEDGNGSDAGNGSDDEPGEAEYPSADEGGSQSSGSSAELEWAQRQREEAEAAAEGGVEEGELLSEEEGAMASDGDDVGRSSADSPAGSASVEPMDEEPAVPANVPGTVTGAQSGAFSGGLDFRALATDSFGQPGADYGFRPGNSDRIAGPKKGGPKVNREVLTELHTVGRNAGRDVTYKFATKDGAGFVTAQVLMGGRVVGEGRGPNKRQAKLTGARKVLDMVKAQGGLGPVAPPTAQDQAPLATPPQQVPLRAPPQNKGHHPWPLQEVHYVYHGQNVDFEELASTGPPHKRTFTFQVTVDGIPVAAASGPSKKAAKQLASEEAIRRKQYLDQQWQHQRSQPPSQPPTAKRPASEADPEFAPAAKRGRANDTGTDPPGGATPYAMFPGAASPAPGAPPGGANPFESFSGGASPGPGHPQGVFGLSASVPPWASGQMQPGGGHLAAGLQGGLMSGVGKKGGAAGKGVKEGAHGKERKLKQAGKTAKPNPTPPS